MIQKLKLPQGMDYVKLPSAMKRGPEDYVARSLAIPFHDLLRIRTHLIRTVAEEFQPDLFLVDHAPIGMSGEITPTLRFLGAVGTKLVLGLRDVLDDPANVFPVWKKQRVVEAMREFYDLILVYGMAEFYDPISEYKIPADVGMKALFTGYVHRARDVQSVEDVRRRHQLPAGPFILVTVGSGEDAAPVLRLVAAALRLRPLEGFSAFISTGPMCPDDVRETLMRNDNERVLVTEFVEDLPSVIASSDLVVSMGGYNSLCELLAYGRRGIVIPRTKPRREQLIRASFLAEHGFITFMNPRECTPAMLRNAIEASLADKSEPLRERRRIVKLDGAQRAAAHILNFIQEKRAAEHILNLIQEG